MHRECQQVKFIRVYQSLLKQEYTHLTLVDHQEMGPVRISSLFCGWFLLLLLGVSLFLCHLVMSFIFSHYGQWL